MTCSVFVPKKGHKMDDCGSHTGGCLCGRVTYKIKSKLKNIVACHCKQCRVWSGHIWASTACPIDKLSITSNVESLSWYISSDHARRGFCNKCGSSLFWQQTINGEQANYYAIAAGSLHEPINLDLDRHIFCKFKGAYYAIDSSEQQDQTY